jgi:hypothetical protein
LAGPLLLLLLLLLLPLLLQLVQLLLEVEVVQGGAGHSASPCQTIGAAGAQVGQGRALPVLLLLLWVGQRYGHAVLHVPAERAPAVEVARPQDASLSRVTDAPRGGEVQ